MANKKAPPKKGEAVKKTTGADRFMRVICNKRLMIPITVLLAVCVVGLTVLLVLDYTGVLYGFTSDKGNATDSNTASDGWDATLLDGKVHESGIYQYRLYTDGTAELYFCKDASLTELSVPAEIDGYKVSAIAKECFVWMPALTTVTVPDGIAYIGAGAFEGCGNMLSLRLPATLIKIGADAFKGCPSTMKVEYTGDVSRLEVGEGNSSLLTSMGASK